MLPHLTTALAVLVWLAAACTSLAPVAPSLTREPIPAPRSLTVFAAASLTDAFEEIGRAFEEAQPGARVEFNFAGSQTLRTQLEQGAVADVFAAASPKEMDAAVAASLVARGTTQVFLKNQLVVILPPDNPAAIQTLQDLARPGLKLVLAAEAAPVGSYSREALGNLEAQLGAGFRDQVLANLISEEDNVKQVVVKVQLGEADAGIVYGSDAVAAPDLKTLVIPSASNVIAEYPIAALREAPQPDLAARFVAYVLSSEGQATLKKWGFTPVSP
jgi:molybdate transport system substrate-binding protein